MRFNYEYSHFGGKAQWSRGDQDSWLRSIFNAPDLPIERGASRKIRRHIRDQTTAAGWSSEARIAPRYQLEVFALKGDLALQLQTGNMSRAAYDLLKLQYLYRARRISGAALALPTKQASAKLGSNVANADRIRSELHLFEDVITAPILIIAFD